ncbi:MAG: insulinase family protein [Desulfovibrionaceae bacterium]|nr:insulinase family protein [Desulfovibrionaceae bacterium]
MALVHGFARLFSRRVEETATLAEVWEHAATGARLLSLINDDENKVFGISFRTPPGDSTGVAHILEHSVLCGSRRYPVKEPFVELLKGSLQTFLNALTFPDKTCYPVASANHQDFENLVEVYLDAVLHPLLAENTFRQEGWHYAPRDQGDQLSFMGVVFNEMKGAYSSPDNLLYECSQHSLFPDTTYGLDSGGDPERIPDLGYGQFLDFHRKNYHPSNSYAFFYGDFDPDRRLEILDAYFRGFTRTEPKTEVPLQRPFKAPARLVRGYAVSEGPDQAKAMFTVNFCLPENGEPETCLALNMLAHILIGLPSSPLRKALMDSGLGEDLAGVGLEADIRQMYFSVGLKGVGPKDLDAAEALIFSTLADLAGQGVDKSDIEAAVNSVEFELRENNTGSYPRGLSLMFRALGAWLYGRDPVAVLAFEAPISAIRARLAAGEPLFEDLLRRHFLDNAHRSTVTLTPDPDLEAGRSQRESERLAEAAAAMGPQGLNEVRDLALDLTRLQAEPDDPEALATIPRLGLGDLRAQETDIPVEVLAGPCPALVHDLKTNGLVYLDLGLDLGPVPDRLLPLVPVFGRALVEMGTELTDFVGLSRRIAAKTGGVEPQTFVTPVRNEPGRAASGRAAARLFLRGKATAARLPELADILGEVLSRPRLDNRERLRQIVLEAKARFEQRLIPAGHAVVASRLRARMGEAHAVNERMHGLSALFSLRDLAGRVDRDFGSVQADLEELRGLLLTGPNLLVNATLEAKDLPALEKELLGLAERLPQGAPAPAPRGPLDLPEREGLSIPAQVNYVGKGVRASGPEFGGAALAVCKHLRTGYLWERVRVQGGAYGAMCLMDRLDNSLCLVSYRDPHLGRTVKAFDGLAGFLRGLDICRDELEKSVIGALGEIDAYLLPDAKGFESMARLLSGQDLAYRQTLRDQVLSTRPGDFRAFAEAAQELALRGALVVMGAAEALAGSGLDLGLTRAL